ncbi:LiaF domain-containing protein [Streptomyces sp. SBT349]|uniref:LiaF domain-containing protein n=1 Tax=Streptomyces sp. SBT349 TaxID=1580539 RepID=UPI00066D5D23|nr:LiaF domain-containing protein [Streptomyces sp. SBT349]
MAPRPAVPGEFRLGGPVLLLALCAATLGTVVAWEHEPLGTTLVIGLSAALAVFGAGLVVSAFFGRLGGGTVVAVVLTGMMLGGASVLPDNITTSWADTRWRPVAASAVRDGYELGSGNAELDLGGIRLEEGQTVSTSVEAGAGQIRVIVPTEARVRITAEVGMGAFTYDAPRVDNGDARDESWGGVGQERTETYLPPDGVEPVGTVELRVEMGLGHVAVERA